MKERDSTEKSDEVRGLTFAQAVDLVGAGALKDAAQPSRFSNWKHGRQPVPWFVVGPLLLRKLSTEVVRGHVAGDGTKAAMTTGANFALQASSDSGLRRAPMPRPLQTVQDLVARIYFHFGPESKQMKAIEDVVALAAPADEHAPPAKRRRTARTKT